MNRFEKVIFTNFCIAVLVAAMSFSGADKKKSGRSKLVIQFDNFVGSELLKLDSVTYKNELGQPYTVSKFKYYISHVRLQRKNREAYTSPDFYLVDQDVKKSKEIILDGIPDGEFTGVSFTLGIDSLHNCSGAQSGALDPVNGMFWAWNTGYVFLKLEGKSPVSKSPGNIFEFHIGGYKQPYNCIREISLSFGDDTLKIAAGKKSFIGIGANVAEIFKAPETIDLSTLSSVTDFHYATMMADNYKDMFSIIGIE